MSNKLIDFINISKSYGTQTVLDDLNLYIRENEFLTLLGAKRLRQNNDASYSGRI